MQQQLAKLRCSRTPILKICRNCHSDLILYNTKDRETVRCIECKQADLPLLFRHKRCKHCGHIGLFLVKEKEDHYYIARYWRCEKCREITRESRSSSWGVY